MLMVIRKVQINNKEKCLKIEDDFDVISGSEFRMETVDGIDSGRAKKLFRKKTVKPKQDEVLRDLLSQLCREQRLTSVQITLEILHGIHLSILKNPGNEKYYRIYTKGRNFEMYLWSSEICRNFLKQVGWQVCGSFIALSKSIRVQDPLKCIEEARSDVEQLLRNRSKPNKESQSLENFKSCIPNGNSKGKTRRVNDEVSESTDLSIDQNSSNDVKTGVRNGSGELEAKGDRFIDVQGSRSTEEVDSDSFEDTLESSEGYIGDEEYLIVDFSTGKHLEYNTESASGVVRMEDDVYGKDGRRRKRRTEEQNVIKDIDEADSGERISLRRRLKERGGDVGLAASEEHSQKLGKKEVEKKGGCEDSIHERGKQREKVSKRFPSNFEGETASDPKTSTDNLYDERGRRRRGHVPTEPPSDHFGSRGYEERQIGTRETATTSTKSTGNESRRKLDKEKKAREMDQTDLSRNIFVCPGQIIKDDESTQGNSNAGVLSRLEVLRRESDSSGSDTGKKKKLVLKRGSMRRKKLQQSDQSTTNNESSGSEITTNKRIDNNVNQETLAFETMNEEHLVNGNSVLQKEDTPAEIKVPEISVGTEVPTISKQGKDLGSTKEVDNSNECHGADTIGESGIQGIVTSLSDVNINKVPDVVEDDDKVPNISTGSVKSAEIANDKVENGVDVPNEEPKKEKKRKFVLRVKRKKVDKSEPKTIETPPAVTRDQDPGEDEESVASVKKLQNIFENNGAKIEGNGKRKDFMKPNVEKDFPKISLSKSNNCENSNGKEPVDKVKNVVNEKTDDQENSKNNDTSEPKKKRFVLKKKKKVAS